MWGHDRDLTGAEGMLMKQWRGKSPTNDEVWREESCRRVGMDAVAEEA